MILWLKAYEMEPWGEWRADLRAGQITAMIANVNTKRGGYKASDFMPKFDNQYERQQQTSEQMKQIAMSMTALMGGVFKGK